MNWKNNEIGPICFCGLPTCIKIDNNNITLICLMHPGLTAICYPLPQNKPDNWPDLSDEEMEKLVDKGFEERDMK